MRERPTTTRHGLWHAAWLVAAVALVAACAKPPVIEPPKPVSITVEATAGADANPDAEGRASPVTVRVYQLADAAAFSSADLLAIWNQESATLGPASTGRYELPLAPGGRAAADFTLDPATRTLGVVAAFRDYRGARWRVSVPVPVPVAPGSKLTLAVVVGRDVVSARWQ